MSVKIMSAVFETEFFDLRDEEGNVTKASTAKLVLLAMADHANDEGEGAYPSVETLARKTALSDQTIRNTWRALRHNGIIFLAGESKYRTNNHTINPESFPRLRGEPDGKLTLNWLEGQMGEVGGSNGSLLTPNPVDPNHQLNINKTSTPLSEKDFQDVNKMVDAMIENSSNPNNWQGRENFAPQHYPLVDWYHKVTGQECPKSKQKDWMRAVSMWAANHLTPNDLQAAYDMDIKWRGVFTSPSQLTDKAIALRAQKQTQPAGEYTRLL